MSHREPLAQFAELASASARLNQHCTCLTLDQAALRRAFEKQTGDVAFATWLIETHPHLFSKVAVFISAEASAGMQAVVHAIEAAAKSPAYRAAALSWAPDIARSDPGPLGAFMGYDFHLGADGPKLIEVNTNAGGAFLNAALARAQDACCAGATRPVRPTDADGFEPAVLNMFNAEWKRQRGSAGLNRVAIVDDDPEGQYLFPEFVLAQRFFQRHGIDAVIADGRRLDFEGGSLTIDGKPIDLVYNRLVDFALDRPEHAALRAAYLDGAVVVTPNPRTHALFADKRDLSLLSDPERLGGWGLAPEAILALQAGVPKTVLVMPEDATTLWSARNELFFKPAGGHGSKAAYRGDKLTKSVWAEILKGGYVAQAYAPPGERTVRIEGNPKQLKADIRLYTYDGIPFLRAARLYQGQTTNFRTAGGGFAPVFQVD